MSEEKIKEDILEQPTDVTDDKPEEVVEEKKEDVIENVTEDAETVSEDVKPSEDVEEAPTKVIKEEQLPEQEEKLEEVKVDEQKKDESTEEDNMDNLEENIKESKEELSVIREVRDELVVLYAKNKDLKVEAEQLSKQVTELTKSKKDIEEQLQRYIDAEEKLMAKEKQERIEQLSKKFKTLGHDKSVEELSKKDEETLSEFETIVDAALLKAGEVEAKPSEVIPTQTIDDNATEKLNDDKPQVIAQTPVVNVQKQKQDFFSGVCKELTNEQLSSYARKKVLKL